jgi:hypothetical protein
MPENEFEKKVSSEMQELKFKPSEQVWLRVEERIRKNKKRRVFVIIFLLAGLALLGYWQRSNLFDEKKNNIVKVVAETPSGEKQKEPSANSSIETNSSSSTDQNTETVNQKKASNTGDKTINDQSTDERSVIKKKIIADPKNKIKKSKNNKKNETRIKPVSGKTKTEQKPEIISDVVSGNYQKQKPVADDNKIRDNSKANIQAEVKPDELKQTEIKPEETKIDSAKTGIIQPKKDLVNIKDTVAKDVLLNDSAKVVVEKKPSEKKWKWGLHLTPGISFLNKSFSIGSNKSFDAYNYQSSVGSVSGPPPARQKPSDIKAGFAFQLGAFVQRETSQRTSLSLGLQYGYYSNILRIGNRRDSLISYSQFSNVLDDKANFVYNAGGDTIKYTNRYHFIELPFLFQWRLNKNKAKPFTWSTGFTVGQLIASNAIMYDTAFNGIYYKNKSQLNKTQFSLSTGFSWTVANNNRVQWSLGPVANVHLSKLIDNPFENKGYLFFIGIRTGVLFNQKK